MSILGNIGKGFTIAFHDLKVGAQAVFNFVTKLNSSPQTAVIEAEINAALSIASPAAASAARLAEFLLGEFMAVVHSGGVAVAAKGLNQQDNAQFVADAQVVYDSLKSHPAVTAVTTPAPTVPPTT